VRKLGKKDVDTDRNTYYTLYEVVETLNLLYQFSIINGGVREGTTE
jgi:hypothetical protein